LELIERRCEMRARGFGRGKLEGERDGNEDDKVAG